MFATRCDRKIERHCNAVICATGLCVRAHHMDALLGRSTDRPIDRQNDQTNERTTKQTSDRPTDRFFYTTPVLPFFDVCVTCIFNRLDSLQLSCCRRNQATFLDYVPITEHRRVPFRVLSFKCVFLSLFKDTPSRARFIEPFLLPHFLSFTPFPSALPFSIFSHCGASWKLGHKVFESYRCDNRCIAFRVQEDYRHTRKCHVCIRIR